MKASFVLLSIAISLAAACSSGDKSELRDAPIDSAEIVTIDTSPPQYEVHIVAEIPGSSCNTPQEPTVNRDGATFHVSVQNLFSGANVCTADLGYRDLTIPLPGPFESGERYEVLINTGSPLVFVAE